VTDSGAGEAPDRRLGAREVLAKRVAGAVPITLLCAWRAPPAVAPAMMPRSAYTAIAEPVAIAVARAAAGSALSGCEGMSPARTARDSGVGEDAIMRIQSMTKVITSVAALRLVGAGRLELDQSLVDWLPELADRQVLRRPAAELDDTVPARRAVTLRHLLTNTSGYGMVIQASPLQQAMAANGTEAGPEPPAMGADEWLRRLTELPLAFQPGEGWRYHHSFGVLGILSRG